MEVQTLKKPDGLDQASLFIKLLGNQMNKPNLPQHPCANKCTDFKGEQCKTCLVQEKATQTCIDCGSPDLYKGGEIKEPKMCLDCYTSMIGFTGTGKGFVETEDVDFLSGDVVVKIRGSDNALYVFATKNALNSKGCYIDRFYSKRSEYVPIDSIRPATTAEIQANRRLTEAEQALAEVS